MNNWILVIGLLWFAIFFIIGLFSMNKNKWGADAVKNYVDMNNDIFSMTTYLVIGIFGLLFLIGIGGRS